MPVCPEISTISPTSIRSENLRAETDGQTQDRSAGQIRFQRKSELLDDQAEAGEVEGEDDDAGRQADDGARLGHAVPERRVRHVATGPANLPDAQVDRREHQDDEQDVDEHPGSNQPGFHALDHRGISRSPFADVRRSRRRLRKALRTCEWRWKGSQMPR
jgi:hypothetical protein